MWPQARPLLRWAAPGSFDGRFLHRDFYRSIFDGQVLLERDPVIMKVANTWLIMNVGGGPTDDKPTVTLATPPDPNRTSAFLNVRVADIQKAYKEWTAKGAEFLTEPKDHGRDHQDRGYRRESSGQSAPMESAKDAGRLPDLSFCT